MAVASLVGPAWPLAPTVFGLGFANGVFAVSAIGSMMGLAGAGGGGREGIRMGVWGAAQAGAFAVGGFAGALGVDSMRSLLHQDGAAFLAVFVGEAAIFIVAAGLASRLEAPDVLSDRHRSVLGAGRGPRMNCSSKIEAETFDAVVIGGGPSGATAAEDLARSGRKVLLLDRAGRIKPCGGAIPPRLMRDFHIPRRCWSRACEFRPHDRAVRPRGGHAHRGRLRRHGRPRRLRRVAA